MLLILISIGVSATGDEITRWGKTDKLDQAWGYGTTLNAFPRSQTHVDAYYTDIRGRIRSEGIIAITVWESPIMPQKITYNYKWKSTDITNITIDNYANTLFEVNGRETLSILSKYEQPYRTKGKILYNKLTGQLVLYTNNMIAIAN